MLLHSFDGIIRKKAGFTKPFQLACRPLMSTEKEEKEDDEDFSEADEEEEELEEGVEQFSYQIIP